MTSRTGAGCTNAEAAVLFVVVLAVWITASFVTTWAITALIDTLLAWRW